MNEIENKLLELWELLKKIPNECKGENLDAHNNRVRFLHIRSTIHLLINDE